MEPEHYAVRWARRVMAGRQEPDWTTWHWTTDGVETLCGVTIWYGTEWSWVPETDEMHERVNCAHCRRILSSEKRSTTSFA